MSRRKVKRRPLKKISVGDMRDRIWIYTRALTEPLYGESESTDDPVLLFERWSKAESLLGTQTGRQMFDDVDMKERPDISFTIRYEASVTSEKVIKFRDEWYEIKFIDDPELRHEYLILYSKVKGSTSKEVNE